MTDSGMTIGFLEPNPSYGGGSEQVCLDLAKGLSQKGHQVKLFHHSIGSMIPDYQKSGVRAHRVPMQAFGWRTLPSCLTSAFRLASELGDSGCKILFASDIQFMRQFSLVSWMSGIPLIYHLGLPSTHDEWSWRLAYRQISIGIAPSEPTLSTWKRDGWPAATLECVPNGVDTEVFRPADDKKLFRQRLGLPEDATIINFTGRLTVEKGADTLLQAYSSILSRVPNSNLLLLLVGRSPGPLEEWKQRASELGIPQARVRFTGERPNRQEYMAASDLVVVPSEWEEPFGLVAIEAMACNIPLVVTKSGVLHHLVQGLQAARIIPPKSPAALADAVLGALETSVNGTAKLRERAKRLFSKSSFVAAYEPHLFKALHVTPPVGLDCQLPSRQNRALGSEKSDQCRVDQII